MNRDNHAKHEIHAAELSAADVAAFLHANPGFLTEHPGLVAELKVPHACGDAVSLLEYQAEVLRDQNRRLRRKIQELVANAKTNEMLSSRLHQLTLQLMGCGDPDAVFSVLRQVLRKEFDAEAVAVRIFEPPRREEYLSLPEFALADSASRRVLSNILSSMRPVCGRINNGQRSLLFGPDDAALCSAAMIPLRSGRVDGLVAVASRDKDRFRPNMGTDFLRGLGEVVARAVSPYLTDSAAS
ncbi:MAG: DUF484 domain-containing protein [Gammaproteobacteria bacterium]|nr:MAG: DUF484 domain-containing protein [Gammaproteobacteria bacterium]